MKVELCAKLKRRRYFYACPLSEIILHRDLIDDYFLLCLICMIHVIFRMCGDIVSREAIEVTIKIDYNRCNLKSDFSRYS